MKRFWKNVAIDASGVVTLDGRPVRTPGRLPLLLPNDALAEAIADEWRAVEGDIDPRTMPLTGLANAAIERIPADKAAFARGLASYADSDLLCYRADAPPPLVDRQAAAWDPALAWARARYDVYFTVTTGVMPVAQPRATVQRLGDTVAAVDAFTLAGLAPVVTLTGSLVLALALIERAMNADDVWTAAQVDEDWQVEMWGEDWLATQTRAAQRKEYASAVRFLGLL